MFHILTLPCEPMTCCSMVMLKPRPEKANTGIAPGTPGEWVVMGTRKRPHVFYREDGEIGRRAGFRFQYLGVGVRVPLLAQQGETK